jgi:small-conductance mechanosensitive channel
MEPEAPIILHQFALFLALVPVLRLLPPRIHEVLGPWPYVATGLYLLHLVGFLFLGNAYYHRLYLLGLTVFSMVLMLWLLWASRRKVADSTVPALARRLVRDAAWLGVAVLALSACANVFGNVSLAEMLTNALLITGYLGLVLYAGVNVLASILRLLLTRGRISQLPLVAQYARPLLRGLTWAMQVAAAIGWLMLVLNQFRIFRPLHQSATAILTHSFTFGEISLTLGSVLTFLLSVFLAFWIAKTTRGLLHEDILPNLSLPRGVANSVSSLSYYALLLLGLLVALAAAGFEVSQLTLVIGALGVGIGLGLQSVVNNFVSGLILMFERPIQPGDIIEITGTAGTVREIGMRATTLSTFEGADVVVPNGTLLSEKLINWTLSNPNRRMDVNVGVAYGNDPEAVLALLLKVTQACSGVATEPEPGVFFNGFGTSSLDFSVRAWTNQHSEWLQTRSDLSVSIYKALVEAGIEIAFPQMDLHLRSVAPEVRGILGGSGE